MKTVIYGVGAMARVLYSYLRRNPDWNVVAFTVDDEFCGSYTFQGLPLVPWRTVQNIYPPEWYQLITAVGYLEMNGLRMRKHQEGVAKGYKYARYIHPTFEFHDGVTVGDDCIIYEHTSAHAQAFIGEGCFLAANVNIGHDCVIQSFNWINSGVMIAGGASVQARCFLGVNSCVASNAYISEESFIGASVMAHGCVTRGSVLLPSVPFKHPMTSKQFLETFK